MIDIEAELEAQIRFNAILVRLLDEAGVISRRALSAALFQSADRLLEGRVKSILRSQAQGYVDGLPPDLTVIAGGKDDDPTRS